MATSYTLVLNEEEAYTLEHLANFYSEVLRDVKTHADNPHAAAEATMEQDALDRIREKIKKERQVHTYIDPDAEGPDIA